MNEFTLQVQQVTNGYIVRDARGEGDKFKVNIATSREQIGQIVKDLCDEHFRGTRPTTQEVDLIAEAKAEIAEIDAEEE